MADDTRPAPPRSCAGRPLHGGLVVPFAQITLADGTPDFLTPHYATTAACWENGWCQVCGAPITHPAIVAGGPNQMADLRFDEAPLCVPCAVYSSRACPMFGGRQLRYASHARVSEGRRGQVCATPGCGCGGFTPTDPDLPGHAGEPAHAYYACYVAPGGWVLTAKDIQTRCSDGGCRKLHDRRIITGAFLTGMPRKVVLVSEPGRGRIWRTLTFGEVAALVTRPWFLSEQAREVLAR